MDQGPVFSLFKTCVLFTFFNQVIIFFYFQIDLLSSRLSEKLVLHVLKFVGAEIELSKHVGFYAQWSHYILMHHGLWIRRKWKDLLPVLNQLQKGLTGKVSDLSELCDRNEQTVNFLLTMAKLKKSKKDLVANEDLDQDEILEESDDEPVEDMEFETVQGELGSLQAKWSDDEN